MGNQPAFYYVTLLLAAVWTWWQPGFMYDPRLWSSPRYLKIRQYISLPPGWVWMLTNIAFSGFTWWAFHLFWYRKEDNNEYDLIIGFMIASIAIQKFWSVLFYWGHWGGMVAGSALAAAGYFVTWILLWVYLDDPENSIILWFWFVPVLYYAFMSVWGMYWWSKLTPEAIQDIMNAPLLALDPTASKMA